MNSRDVTYRIDWDGRIISVNREWTRFAKNNSAPELAEGSVVGTLLQDHIAGDETRHLYALIIEKVHRTNQPAVLPFRCDGPAIKRQMELSILPLLNRETEFRARVIREEETDYLPLLDPAVSRSEEQLLVCGWCRHVCLDDEWVEVEEAVRRLRLFEAKEMPAITHGICPGCTQKAAGPAKPEKTGGEGGAMGKWRAARWMILRDGAGGDRRRSRAGTLLANWLLP